MTILPTRLSVRSRLLPSIAVDSSSSTAVDPSPSTPLAEPREATLHPSLPVADPAASIPTLFA
ncbi:hypothetical protein [Halonotius roseus]|uniref:Uncharacterized protein n=1 Tax=Halonotius roseus TaxID=2511997 RepID=A0A544QLX7_9EURY|nr:hypothetical protein [Halonotius roseus]TQQ79598.1 hypothetical protein EWF95_11345 [Halonotius roseus]